MVPVRCELVVGKLPRLAYRELHQVAAIRCNVRQRKQKSIRWRSKLVALKREQIDRHRIRARHAKVCRQVRRICRTAVGRRHVRNERADQRPRRISAALPRPLIVDEEKSELATRADRPAQAAAENILLNHRSRRSAAFQESIRSRPARYCGKTHTHRHETSPSPTSGSR